MDGMGNSNQPYDLCATFIKDLEGETTMAIRGGLEVVIYLIFLFHQF